MPESRLVIQVSGDRIGESITVLFFLEAEAAQKAGPKKYIESSAQIIELSALTGLQFFDGWPFYSFASHPALLFYRLFK